MHVLSLAVALALLSLNAPARAEEKLVCQLRDYVRTEVKSAGFKIAQQGTIHIKALGGGSSNMGMDNDMFAYGWVINADTRKEVWRMTYSNTSRQKDDRSFDGEVSLPAGEYEVYFAAWGYAVSTPFSSFSFNVDRRKDWSKEQYKGNSNGFLNWLSDFFGNGMSGDWDSHAKSWGMELFLESGDLTSFSPPKEFPNVLYQSIRLGENEHVIQPFTLTKHTSIRIYALGEKTGTEFADYGWIVNARTHERVWQMDASAIDHAGGAEKNKLIDEWVEFDAGDYILYWSTDDSHSYVDWNASPPDDPMNYGVSLMSHDKNDGFFKLTAYSSDEKNVIVQLVRVHNNETRSATFTLSEDMPVRVYALGERSNSRHQMADYGWILNTKTREKVWTMEEAHTENAGGASKNRMVDEVVTLEKGTYTVGYQTDDSHAYNDWNDTPPQDPEHYGISLYAENSADMSKVKKETAEATSDIIAQMVKVGNDADLSRSFELNKSTHVRVYAIGEGQGDEMYDYGWIEKLPSHEIVWQMTYDMTFHAGGGRKNRLVNTTIMLEQGRYLLRFKSDDSHSYNDWNTDPPDDPTMWGITLYRDEK
jgi:hypothetical protein